MFFRNKGREFRKLYTNDDNDYEEPPDGEYPLWRSADMTPIDISPSANSTLCEPPQKKTKKNRFRWTNKMIDSLINCLNEQKTQYEFKGLDFEADLVKLYTDIRIMMAECFEREAFGPVKERNISEGLTTSELAKEKVKLQQDKKEIKAGYDRIKNMAKKIRQNYRKAVTEGKRSGSGKVVCDNWEQLKSIWGGSPATVTLKNAVTSTRLSNDDDDDELPLDQSNDEQDVEEDVEDEVESDESSGTEEAKKKEQPNVQALRNPTPKFVDNKRKNMEKNLSASQRDQVYLNMAKNDLKLKQRMVDQFAAATQESNSAFEKISLSIESVEKSIGDGLLALASAIGNNSHPPTPNQQRHPHNYYYQSYPSNFRRTSASSSSSNSFEAPPSSDGMNMNYYENL